MKGTVEYIGKGKKQENFNTVQVLINMDEAQSHIFEYKGKKYLKFNVKERSTPDAYGNTHGVSVYVPESNTVNEPIPPRPSDLRTKEGKAWKLKYAEA